MKSNLYKLFCLALVVLTVASGCKKDYESIEELDAKEVQEYIAKNNLTGFQQYNNTGIYYDIVEDGTGAELAYTDKVYATFTAKSLDGRFSVQADSLNRYSSFLGYFSRENGYPDAFRTAIKEILKKNGGSIRIIIPSHLAYGRGGNSGMDIPGNASLDCTIKLYDVPNQTEFEDIFVKRYITANKITGLEKTSTGLYYKKIAQGSGVPITPNSLITVAYKGKLTNGTIFDESASYESYLYNLIPGWQEGVVEIQKGGKIRLIIPPSLGYGSSASSSIPPYSTLDFEIEGLEVE